MTYDEMVVELKKLANGEQYSFSETLYGENDGLISNHYSRSVGVVYDGEYLQANCNDTWEEALKKLSAKKQEFISNMESIELAQLARLQEKYNV